MRRISVLAAIGLVALSASVSRAQGTFPLKSEDFSKQEGLLANIAMQGVPLDQVQLAQVKTLPKEIPADARFGVLKIRGRDVLLTLVGDALYVDTDGDGDFSDEKVLKPAPAPAGETGALGLQRTQYGVVVVAGATPGSEARFTVSALAGRYLLVAPVSCLAGQVRLAGKDYRVAMVDKDLDGKFDSRLSMPFGNPPGPDILAIDLDGDGKFAEDFFAGEVAYLAKMTRVGGACYSVSVAPDGSSVTMEKVEPKSGTLDAGTPEANLVFFSDCGLMHVSGEKGSWQLPEGRYHPIRVRLTRKDKDGIERTLTGYGDMGTFKEFEIAPGKTLSLKIGGPLTVKTTVNTYKGQASVSLVLQGQGGETYGPLVGGGKTEPEKPKLRILSEAGKELAAGQFEYG